MKETIATESTGLIFSDEVPEGTASLTIDTDGVSIRVHYWDHNGDEIAMSDWEEDTDENV